MQSRTGSSIGWLCLGVALVERCGLVFAVQGPEHKQAEGQGDHRAPRECPGSKMRQHVPGQHRQAETHDDADGKPCPLRSGHHAGTDREQQDGEHTFDDRKPEKLGLRCAIGALPVCVCAVQEDSDGRLRGENRVDVDDDAYQGDNTRARRSHCSFGHIPP